MSLTIQNLKYQEVASALLTDSEHSYDFLSRMRIIRTAAKGTVNGIDLTGTLLRSADCVVDDNVEAELVGKEVELNYYNLSFPVSDCDLDQTWLSAFANKYRDEADVYIESLVPYLREQIRDEIRFAIHSMIYTEAINDADVTKVALAGTVDTPANAYATVLEFIDGFPQEFVDDALDKYSREYYSIEVSPEAYQQLAIHFSDIAGAEWNIGGYIVSANKDLGGNQMMAQSYRNQLLFIDDSEDLTKIKIVPKPWLSQFYIVTGVAFKGSYLDSKKIVISN